MDGSNDTDAVSEISAVWDRVIDPIGLSDNVRVARVMSVTDGRLALESDMEMDEKVREKEYSVRLTDWVTDLDRSCDMLPDCVKGAESVPSVADPESLALADGVGVRDAGEAERLTTDVKETELFRVGVRTFVAESDNDGDTDDESDALPARSVRDWEVDDVTRDVGVGEAVSDCDPVREPVRPIPDDENVAVAEPVAETDDVCTNERDGVPVHAPDSVANVLVGDGVAGGVSVGVRVALAVVDRRSMVGEKDSERDRTSCDTEKVSDGGPDDEPETLAEPSVLSDAEEDSFNDREMDGVGSLESEADTEVLDVSVSDTVPWADADAVAFPDGLVDADTDCDCPRSVIVSVLDAALLSVLLFSSEWELESVADGEYDSLGDGGSLDEETDCVMERESVSDGGSKDPDAVQETE